MFLWVVVHDGQKGVMKDFGLIFGGIHVAIIDLEGKFMIIGESSPHLDEGLGSLPSHYKHTVFVESLTRNAPHSSCLQSFLKR